MSRYIEFDDFTSSFPNESENEHDQTYPDAEEIRLTPRIGNGSPGSARNRLGDDASFGRRSRTVPTFQETNDDSVLRRTPVAPQTLFHNEMSEHGLETNDSSFDEEDDDEPGEESGDSRKHQSSENSMEWESQSWTREEPTENWSTHYNWSQSDSTHERRDFFFERDGRSAVFPEVFRPTNGFEEGSYENDAEMVASGDDASAGEEQVRRNEVWVEGIEGELWAFVQETPGSWVAFRAPEDVGETGSESSMSVQSMSLSSPSEGRSDEEGEEEEEDYGYDGDCEDEGEEF